MTDAWGTLHIEVLDDEILITLPGTSYAVTVDDNDAPMTQAEFHGRAWKLANDKARELGWIV